MTAWLSPLGQERPMRIHILRLRRSWSMNTKWTFFTEKVMKNPALPSTQVVWQTPTWGQSWWLRCQSICAPPADYPWFPDPWECAAELSGGSLMTYQSVCASSITRRILGFCATGGVGPAEWSISPAAACVVCFMALEMELKMLLPVEEECEGWGGCRCFLSVAGETGELVELSGRCKSIM